MKKHEKALLVIGILVLLGMLLFTQVGMNILYLTGYRAGMQGLDITWDSIRFKDYWYSTGNSGPNPNYDNHVASSCYFVEPLDFDPDEQNGFKSKPNLAGSMGYVTVDKEVAPITYGPWRVKVGEQWVLKKNATHSWQEKQYIYKEFEIKRFKCDWQVNLWLTGTGNEAYPSQDTHYMATEIWMRVVPQSFCYFLETPDQVYFAPALMQVVDVTYEYEGKESPEVATDWDIHPEVIGENFYIYYEKGGAPIDMEEAILQYQGAKLDPRIFRNEYWIKFHIYDLAALSWFPYYPHTGTWQWKWPSYNFKVLIYIFVVGEWTVKLYSGEVKELTPHKTGGGGDNIFEILGNWLYENFLNNPWFWLIMIIVLIFLGLGVLVVLALFAPGFLTAVTSLIGGRRKKKGGG